MPRTKPVDVAADETIESGEGVVGPVNVDSEQATSDEDGDATLTLAIVKGITLTDLTLLSCRWPIGNPRDLTTFRYCGEAAPCGGSYCKRHARLAYPRRKT